MTPPTRGKDTGGSSKGSGGGRKCSYNIVVNLDIVVLIVNTKMQGAITVEKETMFAG